MSDVVEYPSESQSRGTLVFVHGRLGNAALWQPLVDDLRRHYRCLLLELKSGVRPLGTVLSELGSGSVAICHDTGAAAAFAAIEAGAGPSAIVLINPSICASASGQLRMRAWAWKALSCSPRLPRQYQSWLVERHLSWRSWRAQAWEAVDSGIPPAARKFPILALWGAQDRLNPPSAAVKWLALLEDLDYFEHPELGHFPCLERPQWVLAKLRSFLFRVMPDKVA